MLLGQSRPTSIRLLRDLLFQLWVSPRMEIAQAPLGNMLQYLTTSMIGNFSQCGGIATCVQCCLCFHCAPP